MAPPANPPSAPVTLPSAPDNPLVKLDKLPDARLLNSLGSSTRPAVGDIKLFPAFAAALYNKPVGAFKSVPGVTISPVLTKVSKLDFINPNCILSCSGGFFNKSTTPATPSLPVHTLGLFNTSVNPIIVVVLKI